MFVFIRGFQVLWRCIKLFMYMVIYGNGEEVVIGKREEEKGKDTEDERAFLALLADQFGSVFRDIIIIYNEYILLNLYKEIV